MDEYIFSLWLRETGLRVLTQPVVPALGQPLSDHETKEPQRSAVADLDLVDPEGDDDDDGPSVSSDYRELGDHWENTDRVSAVFRAAGNPMYQDVRFRVAKTSHCPDPSHRQVALQRAKRIDRSIEW
jgi:hypothetical protein